jgi:hypothetical protein
LNTGNKRSDRIDGDAILAASSSSARSERWLTFCRIGAADGYFYASWRMSTGSARLHSGFRQA